MMLMRRVSVFSFLKAWRLSANLANFERKHTARRIYQNISLKCCKVFRNNMTFNNKWWALEGLVTQVKVTLLCVGLPDRQKSIAIRQQINCVKFWTIVWTQTSFCRVGSWLTSQRMIAEDDWAHNLLRLLWDFELCGFHYRCKTEKEEDIFHFSPGNHSLWTMLTPHPVELKKNIQSHELKITSFLFLNRLIIYIQ